QRSAAQQPSALEDRADQAGLRRRRDGAERGLTAAQQRGSSDDQRCPSKMCDFHSCALRDEEAIVASKASNFAISALAPSLSNVVRAARAIAVAAALSLARCSRPARSRWAVATSSGRPCSVARAITARS